MTTEQWQDYLRYCSAEMLKDPEVRDLQPESVLESGWMGYEPASQEQIRETEERLGVLMLPLSLRNFYLVSNGWRHVSFSIYDILPVERIGWLKDFIPNLWTEPEYAEEAFARETDLHMRFNLYNQNVRVNRSVVVSEEGDAANLLLDPYVQFSYGEEHNEWAGGDWASWNPAMDWTARSFVELFQSQFAIYMNIRKLPNDAV